MPFEFVIRICQLKSRLMDLKACARRPPESLKDTLDVSAVRPRRQPIKIQREGAFWLTLKDRFGKLRDEQEPVFYWKPNAAGVLLL
jgi:hypothetical protein